MSLRKVRSYVLATHIVGCGDDVKPIVDGNSVVVKASGGLRRLKIGV
jgi:hypothetical protein